MNTSPSAPSPTDSAPLRMSTDTRNPLSATGSVVFKSGSTNVKLLDAVHSTDGAGCPPTVTPSTSPGLTPNPAPCTVTGAPAAPVRGIKLRTTGVPINEALPVPTGTTTPSLLSTATDTSTVVPSAGRGSLDTSMSTHEYHCLLSRSSSVNRPPASRQLSPAPLLPTVKRITPTPAPTSDTPSTSSSVLPRYKPTMENVCSRRCAPHNMAPPSTASTVGVKYTTGWVKAVQFPLNDCTDTTASAVTPASARDGVRQRASVLDTTSTPAHSASPTRTRTIWGASRLPKCSPTMDSVSFPAADMLGLCTALGSGSAYRIWPCAKVALPLLRRRMYTGDRDPVPGGTVHHSCPP